MKILINELETKIKFKYWCYNFKGNLQAKSINIFLYINQFSLNVKSLFQLNDLIKF